MDAIGLGGADPLRAGPYHYEVKDVADWSRAPETPIVDGGELKDTWERESRMFEKVRE